MASFNPIRGRFGDENIFDPPDRAALDELNSILAGMDLSATDTNIGEFAAAMRI
jgi:hypothetical protein